MKLMIDIPDDMIKSIEQGSFGAKYNTYDFVGCLMNGTPLPEGAEILTKEAYSDLCMRAAEHPEKHTEKRTETHACDTKTHACDCISRQAAIDAINHAVIKFPGLLKDRQQKIVIKTINLTKNAIENALIKLPSVEPEKCVDTGEISDGYHTFNQLYHQRAILFAAIVNQNKGISWKSYKHSDGKYCFDSNGEWFIVGVDTPEGSYTYHYSKEYWDYFKCKELDCGKEWDGHTEEDVTRLLSLDQQPCGDCISRNAIIKTLNGMDRYIASELTLCESNDKFSQNEVFVVDDVYEQIAEQLPSVEPERKTGKWIDGKCNRCGTNAPFWAMASTYYCSEYCPNCGAKMEPMVSTKEVIDEFIKSELKGDTDGQS